MSRIGGRRRLLAALAVQLGAALPLAALAGAGAARPACACGGAASYDVYEPFVDLQALVDYDGQGPDYESAILAPHAFRYALVAPFVLADSVAAAAGDTARAAAGDALRRAWQARFAWAADTAPPPPAFSDAAFTAALRAGALDRAEREARALVGRAMALPAREAQALQPLVRRAVEFAELRAALGGPLGAAPGPVLARFFAAPAAPADTPRVSFASPESTAASERRLAAWERAQRQAFAGPVPRDSLPPLLRQAAAIRAMDRAALAAAGDAPAPPAVDAGADARRLRRPSLRYVALDRRLRALTPDGWVTDDSLRAHAAEWRALRAAYARWLADYPDHPLAPLVRLTTVRVDRFALDPERAWATLLAEYPRHRARVVTEMQHLLSAAGEPPPGALARVAASPDPVLRSAFAFRLLRCQTYACSGGGGTGYPRAAWDAAWREAEAARAAPASAAWAVNAEERLLRAALGDTSGAALPAAFPARAEAPTPLWGVLRLALLVRAGRWADAEAQAALLPRGRPAAALRARLLLRRGAWARALGEPELPPDTRRYLVQVLAPDSVLGALARSADTAVRHLALRTRAARLAGGAGDWRGAARLVAPADPALAAALDSAGALAADTSADGRLRLGAFLVAHQGALLGSADDRDWYRTLDDRWTTLAGLPGYHRAPAAIPGAPWAPADERAAVRRALRENSELYLALGAYARAAAALPPARARAAARAGDVAYNRLINRNYEATAFWRRELAADPAVAALRRAGR